VLKAAGAGVSVLLWVAQVFVECEKHELVEVWKTGVLVAVCKGVALMGEGKITPASGRASSTYYL
jgi:hypothetical protein